MSCIRTILLGVAVLMVFAVFAALGALVTTRCALSASLRRWWRERPARRLMRLEMEMGVRPVRKLRRSATKF